MAKTQQPDQIFTSPIVLGATYQDCVTGFIGVAIYVTFNLTGCERVALDVVTEGGTDIKAYEFDATRLDFIKGPTARMQELVKKVEVSNPGGPATRASRV